MKAIVLRAFIAASLALLVWTAWRIAFRADPPTTRRVAEMLQTSARHTREDVQRRILSTRLVVDSIHESNTRALAGRARDRLMDIGPIRIRSSAADTSRSLESPAVRCIHLLRADDRLVRSLVSEIDGTRDLLDDYEDLSATYQREIEACEAVLDDCRHFTRRNRIRSRTFVAAAAIVALAIVLD